LAGQREQPLVLPVNLFLQLMKIGKYGDEGRDEFMVKVKIDGWVLIICLYITANASIPALLVCLPSHQY
jgi:hypothetical protein